MARPGRRVIIFGVFIAIILLATRLWKSGQHQHEQVAFAARRQAQQQTCVNKDPQQPEVTVGQPQSQPQLVSKGSQTDYQDEKPKLNTNAKEQQQHQQQPEVTRDRRQQSHVSKVPQGQLPQELELEPDDFEADEQQPHVNKNPKQKHREQPQQEQPDATAQARTNNDPTGQRQPNQADATDAERAQSHQPQGDEGSQGEHAEGTVAEAQQSQQLPHINNDSQQLFSKQGEVNDAQGGPLQQPHVGNDSQGLQLQPDVADTDDTQPPKAASEQQPEARVNNDSQRQQNQRAVTDAEGQQQEPHTNKESQDHQQQNQTAVTDAEGQQQEPHANKDSQDHQQQNQTAVTDASAEGQQQEPHTNKDSQDHPQQNQTEVTDAERKQSQNPQVDKGSQGGQQQQDGIVKGGVQVNTDSQRSEDSDDPQLRVNNDLEQQQGQSGVIDTQGQRSQPQQQGPKGSGDPLSQPQAHVNNEAQRQQQHNQTVGTDAERAQSQQAQVDKGSQGEQAEGSEAQAQQSQQQPHVTMQTTIADAEGQEPQKPHTNKNDAGREVDEGSLGERQQQQQQQHAEGTGRRSQQPLVTMNSQWQKQNQTTFADAEGKPLERQQMPPESDVEPQVRVNNDSLEHQQQNQTTVRQQSRPQLDKDSQRPQQQQPDVADSASPQQQQQQQQQSHDEKLAQSQQQYQTEPTDASGPQSQQREHVNTDSQRQQQDQTGGSGERQLSTSQALVNNGSLRTQQQPHVNNSSQGQRQPSRDAPGQQPQQQPQVNNVSQGPQQQNQTDIADAGQQSQRQRQVNNVSQGPQQQNQTDITDAGRQSQQQPQVDNVSQGPQQQNQTEVPDAGQQSQQQPQVDNVSQGPQQQNQTQVPDAGQQSQQQQVTEASQHTKHEERECGRPFSSVWEPSACPDEGAWFGPWFQHPKNHGRNWTIMDVGANKGYLISSFFEMFQGISFRRRIVRHLFGKSTKSVTLHLKRYCGMCCDCGQVDTARVHGSNFHLIGVEGNRVTAWHLQKVYQKHSNVRIVWGAVSNVSGTIMFPAADGGNEMTGFAWPAAKKVETPLYRIDELASDYEQLDILLTDMEGFDHLGFSGAQNSLQRKKVSLYMFELGGSEDLGNTPNYTSMFLQLEQWGYDCFYPMPEWAPWAMLPITGPCWQPSYGLKYGWFNALCVSRKMAPELLEIVRGLTARRKSITRKRPRGACPFSELTEFHKFPVKWAKDDAESKPLSLEYTNYTFVN